MFGQLFFGINKVPALRFSVPIAAGLKHAFVAQAFRLFLQNQDAIRVCVIPNRLAAIT